MNEKIAQRNYYVKYIVPESLQLEMQIKILVKNNVGRIYMSYGAFTYKKIDQTRMYLLISEYAVLLDDKPEVMTSMNSSCVNCTCTGLRLELQQVPLIPLCFSSNI